MTTARAGMHSDPPTVVIEPIKQDGSKPSEDVLQRMFPKYTEEQKKYIKCWELDDYRNHSPGEGLVDLFMELGPETSVIDWGCGTGRASKKLFENSDLDITMVDFAYNCLDDDVKALAKSSDRLRFIEQDLTKPSNLQSEWGFCTDVMEHIPTDDVDEVLKNILYSSKQVFFQISTADDIFSRHPDLDVDSDLHLTVKDYQWWLEKFTRHRCIIHRSKDLGNAVIFFVTGWSERSLGWNAGTVNTDIETIKRNMAENAKLGIQAIKPHVGDGEVEVMLLCGGPTLNEFEDEIKAHRENGVKCITVNGTYNWCIERGIRPSLQCMVDARGFMHRFVNQVPGITDETKYVISSQCDPKIFEGLPHDRTYMWQASVSKELVPHVKEHYGRMYEDWYPSPGGTTVGLRALMLLRMLGFNKIHIYGMDSCVFPDKHHHAYEQEENDYLDEKDTLGVVVGKGTEWEKTFQCQLWHAFQAAEFQAMVPNMPDDLKLQVHGDGLIAYYIQSAAKFGVQLDLEIQDQAKPPAS